MDNRSQEPRSARPTGTSSSRPTPENALENTVIGAEAAEPTRVAAPAGERPVSRGASAGQGQESDPTAATNIGNEPAPRGSDDDLQPDQMLGDFRIVRKLGQGGMGAVYLARQISLDRQVALKLLSRHIAANPAFVERFYREARAMAKLDHPNVVRGYAVGQADGLHYVAMELIDGKSVQDWLVKLGRLSVGDAVHIGLRAAEALEYAHENNLIHRDVKPDNMLITSKGVVKVSDLGLAKNTDEDHSMTQSGTGMGTPYYMAPEQARNAKHVDRRSDIYALGSTLYHLLAGDYPFKAESTLELILAKEKGSFPPLRKHNSEVPERLGLVIEKMMAKEPKHRYQTCGEVQRDLEGLHLANASLSFIAAPAGSKGTRSSGTARQPAGERPARPGAEPVAAGAGGGPAADVYYIRDVKEDGRIVKAKFTSEQLQKLVKAEQVSIKAKASRNEAGPFIPLAQFPELQGVVHQRLVKSSTDKKGESFKDMYKQIDRMERRKRFLRPLMKLFDTTRGLISLAIWLACIAGVVGGGYWGVKTYVLPQIAKSRTVQSLTPAATSGNETITPVPAGS